MKKRFARCSAALCAAICLLLCAFPLAIAAETASAAADRAADMAGWRVTPEELLPNSTYWEQHCSETVGLSREATLSGTRLHIGAVNTAALGWCLDRPLALDGLHLYWRDLRFESDRPLFTITFDPHGASEQNKGSSTLRFDLDGGSLHWGDTELIPAGNTVIRSIGAGQETELAIKAQGSLLRLTLTTPAGTASADFAPPACAAAAYLNFSTHYVSGQLSFELLAAHGGNEPCIPMTPDYDAVRYAVDSADFNNHNWWGDRLVRADLQGGGLRVRIRSDATGHIGVLYGERVSTDGLSLNFARLQGGGDNSNLCLLFGEEPGKGYDGGQNSLLIINFTEGAVYTFPPAGKDYIINANDFIKGLADGQTPFRLTLSLQRDGNCLVTLETLQGSISGVWPSKHLGKSHEAAYAATNLFISCHGSNDTLEFDLLSLRHGDMRDFGTATRRLYDAYIHNAAYAAAVREGIDALGRVTIASGAEIERLETAYAALYDPTPVTNYASLLTARRAYDALFEEAVEEAAPADYDRRIGVRAAEFSVFNATYTVRDVQGGVQIGCNSDPKWSGRTVLEVPLDVDGLRIEMTGQDSLGTGALALALMGRSNQWTDGTMTVLLLEPQGGLGSGTLRIVTYKESGEQVRVVPFARGVWGADSLVVEWRPVGDGDSLALLVNGQNMGLLSKQDDLGLSADGACYAAFGYWTATNGDAAVTLTDVSCESDFVQLQAVEKAIGAIGEVTRESGAAIDAAQVAYKALPNRLKRVVKNFGVLSAAVSAYELLLTGTTGTTLPMQTPTTARPTTSPGQTVPPTAATTGQGSTADVAPTTPAAVTTATAATNAVQQPSTSQGGTVSVLRVAAIAVAGLALAAVGAAVAVVLRRRKG